MFWLFNLFFFFFRIMCEIELDSPSTGMCCGRKSTHISNTLSVLVQTSLSKTRSTAISVKRTQSPVTQRESLCVCHSYCSLSKCHSASKYQKYPFGKQTKTHLDFKEILSFLSLFRLCVYNLKSVFPMVSITVESSQESLSRQSRENLCCSSLESFSEGRSNLKM